MPPLTPSLCSIQVLIQLSEFREVPVTEADARRMAHNIRAAAYIECSALTQNNVKEVFDQCIVSGLAARRQAPAALPRPASPQHKKRRGWRRCLCL